VTIRVERFSPVRRDDFLALHSDANGAGWCRCVAWWVPTWDGWGERTAEENTALRDALCARGQYDGLLAYDGNEPVGWCQLGQRDRLTKLVAQLELDPDPLVWAVTCFFVAPARRNEGIAVSLLAAAVEEARLAEATRIEGYPRNVMRDDDDAWTGPQSLFTAAGFEIVRAGTPLSVASRTLR
jgi:GNAT superfamily N-acetyltransferase